MQDRRALGLASLLVAAGPLAFIAIFGSWGAAGLSQTDSANPAIAFPFLRAHGLMVLAPTLNSLVMHLSAIVLAIGLAGALAPRGGLVVTVGATLGVAWGVLDIAQSLITYNAVLAAPVADPASIDVVTKGMQNAGHLGGGLWTLSIVLASAGLFGGAHRTFGLVAGLVFALHPLIVPIVPAWFYAEFVLLPLWFGWTGIAILRSSSSRRVEAPAFA
jgi:hypothetical protein